MTEQLKILAKALILIGRAVEAVSRRRKIEQAVGYPVEYGDDAEVLADMVKFLKSAEVRSAVDQVLSEH